MMQVLFLLLFVSRLTMGFLPSQESGRPDDYTHQSITEKGIYQAAASFIKHYIMTSSTRYASNNPVNITETFFREDSTSEIAFGTIVESIVNANNKAQKLYGDMAIRTMNAEQITAGHFLMMSLREQILKLASTPNTDMTEVRKLIGEYLFSLQMFYSNTNWVETMGNKSCKELGISGATMMPTATPNIPTCIDCTFTHPEVDQRACENNILINGVYLTSGYLGYQHIPKPQGNASLGIGKCSHGGRYDTSQKETATGGINKETSDPDISPHFFLHSAAGEAAVEATAQFFVGEVTGILDQIGPRLFGELLGIPVACKDCLQPNLSLAYVIDTSLSMSEDLKQIKLKVRDTVMAAMLKRETTPHDFILATFSDPVTLNTIRNTTDGNDMISWFQALTQKGGGDCPEYAFNALREALKIIRPGSCLFFYSDADPKDAELEPEVVNLALKKNIHIDFLIKGSCNTGIPFYSRLENSTKTVCSKKLPVYEDRVKRHVVEVQKSFQDDPDKKLSKNEDINGLFPNVVAVTGCVVAAIILLTIIFVLITRRRSSRTSKHQSDVLNPNNT